MKIKKLLLMMVLLTIAGRAFADEITVSPVSMSPGETKKVAINLDLSNETYSALEFDLVLPKGISVALNSSNKLRILIADDHRQIDEDEQKSHSISFNQSESDENSTTYKVVIYDGNNAKLKSGSGAIVNCYIKADESASGSLTAYVKNILLAASGGSGGTVGGTKLTDASFTITLPESQPAITVTAKSYSRAYGEANPTFEYDVTGGTLTGTPTLTCTATSTSDVGEYAIVVTQGSVTNSNVTYVDGTLTITKATPTVTAPTAIEGKLTYSGAAQNLVNAGSTTGGELQYALSAGGTYSATIPQGTAAGDYTIYYKVVGGTNYEDVAEAGPINKTIVPAALTISCGTYTIKQGEALPEFEAVYDGFVNDETDAVVTTKPTLTTMATSASARGSYEVTVSGAEAANYDISYQNGTLIVTEVVVADGGTTIEEGEDGYYVVTIDEEGGSSSENGVIGDTQLDNEGKIEVAELTYTRELDAPTGGTADVTIEGSEAKLYTTCLPEAPTTADNAKYYTLDAANNTTLTFVEVANSNLAANTPYLVAVTSGDDLNESQNVTNVTLKKEADNSVEKDGFVFKGTLTGLTNAEAAAVGAYILQSGNVWGKVTTAKPTAYIPACRAYIVSTSATAPAILNGNLGDGTTRIQNIRTVDMNGTEHWYDLNGRRIQKPTKGINIQNGRKVVVK